MGRLVTIMLVAAAFATMGATPLATELLQPGKDSTSLDILKSDIPAPSKAFQQRPRRTCYYIRQLNANLHKPKDKPELVPLAADAGAVAEKAPGATSKPECMTDAVVREAASR